MVTRCAVALTLSGCSCVRAFCHRESQEWAYVYAVLCTDLLFFGALNDEECDAPGPGCSLQVTSVLPMRDVVVRERAANEVFAFEIIAAQQRAIFAVDEPIQRTQWMADIIRAAER